jgi:predicted negative regulator of RcsB-dependent stress response
VHFQKGDLEKALTLLEQAAKLEPKEGVIFEHLGDVKKAKGDRKTAHALYDQALHTTLEPKDRERIEKKLKDSGG